MEKPTYSYLSSPCFQDCHPRWVSPSPHTTEIGAMAVRRFLTGLRRENAEQNGNDTLKLDNYFHSAVLSQKWETGKLPRKKSFNQSAESFPAPFMGIGKRFMEFRQGA